MKQRNSLLEAENQKLHEEAALLRAATLCSACLTKHTPGYVPMVPSVPKDSSQPNDEKGTHVSRELAEGQVKSSIATLLNTVPGQVATTVANRITAVTGADSLNPLQKLTKEPEALQNVVAKEITAQNVVVAKETTAPQPTSCLR